MPSFRKRSRSTTPSTNEPAEGSDDNHRSHPRGVESTMMTTSLTFLAHCQLHEVLFDFLGMEDILGYRALHSTCGAVVLHYARTAFQDVFGQDFWACATLNPTVGGSRTIDAALSTLLVHLNEDFGHILASSALGARSLNRRLFHREWYPTVVLTSLCSSRTVDWVRTVLHVDLSDSCDLAAEFLQLFSFTDSPLLSLNVENGNCTDELLKRVAMNCGQLQSLNVRNSGGRITDESIKLVAMNCRQLRSLKVGANHSITDKSIRIIANCLRLESLDVSANVMVSDYSMKLVATNCHHLRSLDVRATSTITDELMKMVAVNCLQLESLKVGASSDITDASMKVIAANCRQLHSLSVLVTGETITDDSIIPLMTGNRPHRLQALELCYNEDHRPLYQNCGGELSRIAFA